VSTHASRRRSRPSKPHPDGSFAALPWTAIQDRRLTGNELRMLAALYGHRRNRQGDRREGFAFASQATLSAEVGVSTRTGIRLLNALASIGWHRVTSRFEIDPDFKGNAKARAYEVGLEPNEEWARAAITAQKERSDRARETMRRCDGAVTSTHEEAASRHVSTDTTGHVTAVMSDVSRLSPEHKNGQNAGTDPATEPLRDAAPPIARPPEPS